MSKINLLDKIAVVINEIEISGNEKEADWLIGIKKDMSNLDGKKPTPQLRKKMDSLYQKLISPRGYIDTQGELDMPSWANILHEIAKELNDNYCLQSAKSRCPK